MKEIEQIEKRIKVTVRGRWRYHSIDNKSDRKNFAFAN